MDAAAASPSPSPSSPAGLIGWAILRLTAMAEAPKTPNAWTNRLTLALVVLIASPDLAALVSL